MKSSSRPRYEIPFFLLNYCAVLITSLIAINLSVNIICIKFQYISKITSLLYTRNFVLILLKIYKKVISQCIEIIKLFYIFYINE